MTKDQDRTIYQRPDGSWVNERHDAERATSIHETQAEAIQRARELLAKQGGGELIIKGENGKIRAKDTVHPGNDPKKIKG